MADWFTQNAPKAPPATTGAGDWFAANAPTATSAVPGMDALGGTPPAYPKVKTAMDADYRGDRPLGGLAAKDQSGMDAMTPGNAASVRQRTSAIAQPNTGPIDLGPTARGVGNMGRGVARIAQNPTSLNEVAGGTSDVIRGGMEAASPALAPALATAPLVTAAGLGAGAVAHKIGSGTASALGAPEGVQELAGDIASIPAGIAGARLGRSVPGKVADYMDRVDPKSAMIKGIKPAANRLGFDKAIDRAMPELKASEAQLGKPVASVDDALAATKLAKQRVWASYKQLSGGSDMVVDTNSLSQKLSATDPDAALAVSALGRKYGQTMGEAGTPGSAGSTTGTTNVMSRAIPLDKAEALLKQKNAELDAFYAKYPTAQRTAASAHPEIASAAAEANALRDAIYNTLDSDNGGAGPRAIKQKYGALIEIEKGLERRRNVAARQQPDSLSEQVGKWSGYGDVATGMVKMGTGQWLGGAADIAGGVAKRQISKALKESQTTDNLIRRAFKYYQGDTSGASPQVPNAPEASTTSPFAPNAPQPPVSVAGSRYRTMTPPQSVPPVMSVGGTNTRQMLPLKRLDQ